ncbi:MAG TPA: DUF4336 domain-containing protein [Rhizomicrobium sp.]|jgi:hypothetical protein|nr:DUF4336 domain-containing protein [Rhizomicrobium sp.]
MSSTLEPLGTDIWIAEGPVVSFFGFPYPTRMALIRLGNGDLFVWSPIALTPELKTQVDALGPVKHLVSPNKIHHLFMGDWKAVYPAARLYASPGLAKRRRDLKFDAELGNAPDPAWAADIDQVEMAGSFAMTEIVFFHRASRTAIFADLIENFRPGWFKGWKGIVARLDGIVMPPGGPPREWRLSFWNRTAAKAALARIMAWQAQQVVVAHGESARQNGADFIRGAFGWLAHN